MKTTFPRKVLTELAIALGRAFVDVGAILLIALGPACIDVGAIAGPSLGADGGMTCAPCLKKMGCSDTSRNLPDLVSGLESGCGIADPGRGRDDGGWFTIVKAGQSEVNPNTQNFANFAPSCDGANGSCYSACISGRIAGPGYPYAGIGLVFHNGAFMYDLSPWRGVSFFVRGRVGASSELTFLVATAAVSMLGVGSGTCDTLASSCGDLYQIPVPGFTAGASHDWERKLINFSSLTQRGFGTPEPWLPATALTLQWNISPLLETIADDQFQVCVDQVELVP